MEERKRTDCFARAKATPNTLPGVYIDPDVDGVLLTMSDGKEIMQLALTPNEAKALSAALHKLAALHRSDTMSFLN